ncbi:hypothetical protein DAEQUDRAFT_765833 [Daedalea quercina L-15889]|uniref:Peptidase C14 caspase domain-containing protein n=1 Tax=Daedalea quercina L-15889 TaxID=1314783 RepID=A0A165Q609_9APHY|nr:hypothetical protein DAEQUDRAFT_765833 [Daedalea quercina L-15889]
MSSTKSNLGRYGAFPPPVSRQESDQNKRTLSMERVEGHNVWVIVVGIDRYKNENFSPLKGCRNDTEDICEYLMNVLKVPKKSNIVHLQDQEATRSTILKKFDEHFITNAKITNKSVALFYFAGHGARAKVDRKEWRCDNKVVESICPYDEGAVDAEGKEVYGIPQPTLQALFDKLEKEKRCNTLVILDSCHSGGMFRETKKRNTLGVGPPAGISETVRSPRFSDDKPRVLPDYLDRDLRKASMISVTKSLSDAGLRTGGTGEHSYIVLAACGKDQPAHEVKDGESGKWRGAFTLELVRMLRKLNDEQKHYDAIVSSIRLASSAVTQRPECRGIDRFKRVFMHYEAVLQRPDPTRMRSQ